MIDVSWYRRWFGRERPVSVLPTMLLPDVAGLGREELLVLVERQKQHVGELNKYITYLEQRLVLSMQSSAAVQTWRPDGY